MYFLWLKQNEIKNLQDNFILRTFLSYSLSLSQFSQITRCQCYKHRSINTERTEWIHWDMVLQWPLSINYMQQVHGLSIGPRFRPRIRGGSRLHPIEANGGLRIMSKNGSPTANMMILLVDVLRYACLREFFGPGGHLLSTHCHFNFTSIANSLCYLDHPSYFTYLLIFESIAQRNPKSTIQKIYDTAT